MATTAFIAGSSPSFSAEQTAEIPKRTLGRTGEEVSLIGLGGHHIGHREEEGIESSAAPSTRHQLHGQLLGLPRRRQRNPHGQGPADGYRKKVFLMTKIDGRTKKAAAEQIDESLKRLQTDVIDLLQFHEVIRMEDPDRIFAEGGAMEAVLAAKKAGKVRFIGFTGHKDPLVHLRMLEVAAEHSFRFDAVQMPLNVMDAHFRSFASKVLPVLVKEGIGVLGMKSMGDGLILKSKAVDAGRVPALRDDPADLDGHHRHRQNESSRTGPSSRSQDFKPMSKDRVAPLLKKTEPFAMAGKYGKV